MTNPRNLIGAVTALFCVGAGVFFVINGINNTWRGIGVLVLAAGLLRAWVLHRDWQKIHGGDRRQGDVDEVETTDSE